MRWFASKLPDWRVFCKSFAWYLRCARLGLDGRCFVGITNFLSLLRLNGPHPAGRKLVHNQLCCERVDFCPFRGPDAPLYAREMLSRRVKARVSLLGQKSQSARAFSNASFHVYSGVKLSRFFPQRSCLLGLASIEFEDRQGSNSICQVRCSRRA